MERETGKSKRELQRDKENSGNGRGRGGKNAGRKREGKEGPVYFLLKTVITF